MALNRGLYRDIKPASEELIVYCEQIPVSEHMWAYLEFSYDREFKNLDLQVVPDDGEYDLYFSENGKFWQSWQQNLAVDTEDYVRQYKVAGWVDYVKAVPVTTPAETTPIQRLVGTYDIPPAGGINPQLTFPAAGSGGGGEIMAGDIFEITTGGIMGFNKVEKGSYVIARVDNAGQFLTQWIVIPPATSAADTFVPGQLYARLTVAKV